MVNATANLTWRNFNLYWFSQTAAQIAGQVLTVGFPLLAVEVMHLHPLEASITTALQFIPYLLVTPVAGAIADRVSRLRLVMLCHLTRALLLGMTGTLYVSGMLSTPVFWITVFMAGVLNSMASVGTMALVPDLAPPGQLVKANSRLQLSMSAAQVLGPAAGGALVAWGGGAAYFGMAIIFAFSGLTITRTAARPTKSSNQSSGGWIVAIGEGFRYVRRTRILNVLLVQMTLFNLFEQAVVTLFTLFAINELGFGAAKVGLVLGGGAIGSVIGAAIAGRFPGGNQARLTMLSATAVASSAPILLTIVPAGSGSTTVATSTVIFGLYGVGLTVFNVHCNAIRHKIAPPDMQGRMAATFRMAAFSTVSVGAGAAGFLAEQLPYRVAIGIACAGLIVSCVVFGVRLLRTPQETSDEHSSGILLGTKTSH